MYYGSWPTYRLDISVLKFQDTMLHLLHKQMDSVLDSERSLRPRKAMQHLWQMEPPNVSKCLDFSLTNQNVVQLHSHQILSNYNGRTHNSTNTQCLLAFSFIQPLDFNLCV